MTPAAKPKKPDCIAGFISFRIKKIVAAPRVVIRNVNPVPIAASIYGFEIVIFSFLSFPFLQLYLLYSILILLTMLLPNLSKKTTVWLS